MVDTEAAAPGARVSGRSFMKAHHIAALIGSVGLSGIALTDAFVQATTGHDSIFADDAGPVGAVLASDVWHGLTYAALTWVLVAEAALFVAAHADLRRHHPGLDRARARGDPRQPRGDRRPGAGWILPVTAMVVALAFLAPAYAHPGWVETVVNVGIALIGVGVVTRSTAGAGVDAEVSPSSSRP
jgi:hypothetical protein